MFIVRPVATSDIPALIELAAGLTQGVHTMAKTPAAIERAVEQSLRSFASQTDIAGEECYLFVLEDLENTSSHSLIGSAAISATAGSKGTFFSFRNDVIQQVSRDLDISHSVHALTLCADLTSYSQLSSFFVRRGNHIHPEAALLSRARLMFAACAPERFSDNFFVSLAGYTDQKGCAPFWEALGKKFFQMDFLEAERLVDGARNRNLIVELMPHYPVYVPLLTGDAQAAMGQVHPESEVPFDLLTKEGFAADDFIDIFDGGPILEANKHALSSFAHGLKLQVETVSDDSAPISTNANRSYLVATARETDFRATMMQSTALENTQTVRLSSEVMQALNVIDGDHVLCVPW
ncbi:arginine N-succinyltransferase [Solimicrobium silvestre]|uniref:Arginine and ornithine succinyltransferase subunit n=1 Tax=Solimicrobium silvestre TaxID=2099400 RepID=A0A2S9H495_9BURK|nr:arginine N-succinyltransferase [Solimicrobium silvestre]PRC94812.1 Arginine and ornithine succinyltransferase subunit [Solimicrobium silvestre]